MKHNSDDLDVAMKLPNSPFWEKLKKENRSNLIKLYTDLDQFIAKPTQKLADAIYALIEKDGIIVRIFLVPIYTSEVIEKILYNLTARRDK